MDDSLTNQADACLVKRHLMLTHQMRIASENLPSQILLAHAAVYGSMKR